MHFQGRKAKILLILLRIRNKPKSCVWRNRLLEMKEAVSSRKLGHVLL